VSWQQVLQSLEGASDVFPDRYQTTTREPGGNDKEYAVARESYQDARKELNRLRQAVLVADKELQNATTKLETAKLDPNRRGSLPTLESQRLDAGAKLTEALRSVANAEQEFRQIEEKFLQATQDREERHHSRIKAKIIKRWCSTEQQGRTVIHSMPPSSGLQTGSIEGVNALVEVEPVNGEESVGNPSISPGRAGRRGRHRKR
jgi:chromosome segregation ATPase